MLICFLPVVDDEPLSAQYVYFRRYGITRCSARLLVSMAIGLFVRAGVCTASFLCRVFPYLNGLHCKVTGVIIRKSLRLSRRARLDHNPGQITTLVSTDTARLDWCTSIGHKYVILVVLLLFLF